MEKVSVLLPVYNAAAYIEESIHSILRQTYQDFELVVIDDGSTDGTLEKILGISDNRIKVTAHGTNIGLVKSLNEGLSLCTGEYVARMDGDDISLPHRIEQQVAYMDANWHIGVCGGQAQILGSDMITKKPTTHEEIICWQLFHCTFIHPTVIFRRSVVDAHGIRYLPYAHAEDYEIWNRLGEVTQLANLPNVLLIYRLHPGQVSNVYQGLQEQSAERIRRLQFGQLGLDPSFEEYQIHLDLCHYRIRVHELDHYQKCLAWAHKILEANLRMKKYEQNTLNTILSRCFSASE
ncbi:glycosyltransferase [Paenibacillus sp. 19GGS1-52]|uniref:glycosyltransferase family 2 protein n=1 Tax=Paenibacillus sp. 19GGS1-52 TaxID=2758563 RepID=UPI001EFABE6C|nr:glycosyltransferase [Paenibacillus sp. 19GGS1-52]ULO05835.1 glycosyltransferase [Paenibacillus sp. 19GGS1-52]